MNVRDAGDLEANLLACLYVGVSANSIDLEDKIKQLAFMVY